MNIIIYIQIYKAVPENECTLPVELPRWWLKPKSVRSRWPKISINKWVNIHLTLFVNINLKYYKILMG